MAVIRHLITDELGYCCVHAFYKEHEKVSGKHLGEALGVSSNTANYWRSKYIRKELQPCGANCPRPLRRSLELKKTASGRVYFARSAAR